MIKKIYLHNSIFMSFFFLVVVTFTVCLIDNAFAYTTEPITDFTNNKSKDIQYTDNKIIFYGVEISKGQEEVVAIYKRNKIFEQDTGLAGTDQISDAYVVKDFPVKEMITLAIPISNGGGSCCMTERFITKTPGNLILTTIDSGQGVINNKENIANNIPIAVGIQATELLKKSNILKKVEYSSPYGMYPDYYIVFDSGKFRLAKPGEFKKEYSKTLSDFIQGIRKDYNTKAATPYIDLVETIIFYAAMAGKSEDEAVSILKSTFPKYKEAFLKNSTSSIYSLINSDIDQQFDAVKTEHLK
ncbi:hypothetical protein [Solidesulfovibrio alcoholivorans]|uniref:hypothetical protein n=1 Tax=Solidesulfovibrio alcoholivorans TaxID=81406 RepID=UPI0012EBC965|nr:hypothetical protein [Solidesulfovibrio alcoholivorans]